MPSPVHRHRPAVERRRVARVERAWAAFLAGLGLVGTGMAGLGLAGLGLGASTPAAAQGLGSPDADGSQHEQVFFVPRLLGALTFDVALDSRISTWARPEVALPETQIAFHVGYLHYLDFQGVAAVGGYLGGGFGLPSNRYPEPPQHGRFDLGAVVRLRGISPRFVHGALSLWIEGSLIDPGTQRADLSAPPSGYDDWIPRVAGGVEAGLGLLWFLDPYLTGEVLFRLGAEAIVVEGVAHPALIVGLRINFDWARRLGSADDLDDPDQPPPAEGGAWGPARSGDAVDRALERADAEAAEAEAEAQSPFKPRLSPLPDAVPAAKKIEHHAPGERTPDETEDSADAGPTSEKPPEGPAP